MTELEDILKDVPYRISSPVEMSDANEEILIYKGEFNLIQNSISILVNGEIKFKWFPELTVKFSATVDTSFFFNINYKNKFGISVNGLHFGSAFISVKQLSQVCHIEGSCYDAVWGDKSIAVTKVKFAIPNLREYFGDTVQAKPETGISTERARLTFATDEYVINIDKLKNSKNLYQLLDDNGGYLITYAGEVTTNKRSILFDDLKKLIPCLNHFLYFLNGRRTVLLFITGFDNGEEKWKDFGAYNVATYKYVSSWSRLIQTNGFNDIWQSFNTLWKDENNKNFLETVLHWYIEANGQAAYIEGSIIFAQAALELIYNWLIVEKKKLLIGKDANDLQASNKIRLILSQLKVNRGIPNSLSELTKLEDFEDGPAAFVFIRNCLVHGQEQKRKELISIPKLAIYEALQLGLWYIELSLLFILGYHGNYKNRVSGNVQLDHGENVPWRNIVV